jgi:hypothetical protein
MKAVWIAFLTCAAAMPVGAGERDPLTIRVSPSVAFAPANLVVRASVLADPDNRTVEFIAQSDDFYRSSEIPLDGDRAPRTTTFEFRNLPRGSYEVRAILRGSAGAERAAVRQQVNVIAAGVGH